MQKNWYHQPGAPTDLYDGKKVAWLTRDPNWCFRCLDFVQKFWSWSLVKTLRLPFSILLHILVERSGGGCVMAGTQIVLAMVEPTWHRHLAPPALTPSAHWAIPPRYPTAPKLASWPLSQHWMWLFPSIQSPTIYLDPNQQRHFNYCHWKGMVGCL